MIVILLAILMLHNRKIAFYEHNIMHVYITYTCREPYHGSLKAAYEPFNESPKVRLLLCVYVLHIHVLTCILFTCMYFL